MIIFNLHKIKNMIFSINKKYVPKSLSKKDKLKQINSLKNLKKNYEKKNYKNRIKIKSFHSKPSNHIKNAEKIYKVSSIKPNKELSKKTLCKLSALKKIVNKGQGAYYSSGSRPNQTSQSWGRARLASSLTGGKASIIDYSILKKGCKTKSKALKLANKRIKSFGKKLRKSPKLKL
jgi:hypothetical protein